VTGSTRGAVLLAGLLLGGPAALAQFREGQPPVLEPAAPPAPQDRTEEIRKQFRSAYQAAGAPRIALFWNVALTDQDAEGTIQTSRIRGQDTRTVNRLEEQTNGDAGNARLVDGEDRRNIDLTVNRSSRASDSAKRGTPLAERDAWLLESGFTKALMDGGADLIDRNLIMRITAAQTDGKDRDARTIESKALLGKADLLLDVLMTRDTDSPLGWGFRCTLREIATGRLKGSFYSKAVPLVAPTSPHYRATNTGFQRVDSRPVVSIELVGTKLALHAMAELPQMLSAPSKAR
jgi:hypothetical protein